MKKYLCGILLVPVMIGTAYSVSVSQASAETTEDVYMQMFDSLLEQIATLQKQVLELQKLHLESEAGSAGSGTASNAVKLSKQMHPGDTNSEIDLLQQILATDPALYADGRHTGFFGPLTTAAVAEFQKRFAITGEDGFVGKKTLQYLNTALALGDVTGKIPPGLLAKTGFSTEIKNSLNNPPQSDDKEFICHNNQTILVAPSAALTHLSTHAGDYAGVCLSTSKGDQNKDDQGEVDEFSVEIKNREAYITVEYENGDDDSLALNLFDEGDIIHELADRFNMDKDDVEDITNFENKSEIDEINVVIGNNEAKVTVEYEDSNDDDKFTVDDDDKDDIIEAIADKLNQDEDDIKDLIDFDEEDEDEINEIKVRVDDGEADVTVEYKDGDDDDFTLDMDDKDDIIEELADRLDLDENDVEDLLDYRD